MILPAIQIKPELQPGTQATAKQGASSAPGELESFGAKLREATQLQGAGAELAVSAEEGEAKAAGVGAGGQSRSEAGTIESAGSASSGKSTLANLTTGALAGLGGDRTARKSGAGVQPATLAGGKSAPVGAVPGGLAGGGVEEAGVQTLGVPAGEVQAGPRLAEDEAKAASAAKRVEESGSLIGSETAGESGKGVIPVPVLGVERPIAGDSVVMSKHRAGAGASATGVATAARASASKNASTRESGGTASSRGLAHDLSDGLPASGLIEVAAAGASTAAAIAAGAGQSFATGRQTSQSVEVSGAPSVGVRAAAAKPAARVSPGAAAGGLGASSVGEAAANAADFGANVEAKPDTRSRTADAKDWSVSGVAIPAAGSLNTADTSSSLVPAGVLASDLAVAAAARSTASEGVGGGEARGADSAQAGTAQTGARAAAGTANRNGTLVASLGDGTRAALPGIGATAAIEVRGTTTGGEAALDQTAAGGSPGASSDGPATSAGSVLNGASSVVRAASAITKTAGLATGVGSGFKNAAVAGSGMAAAAVPAHSAARSLANTNVSGQVNQGAQIIERGRAATVAGVSVDARPVAAKNLGESSAKSATVGSQSVAASQARAAHPAGENGAGRSVAENAAADVAANVADGMGASGNSAASSASATLADRRDAAAAAFGTPSTATTGHAAVLPSASTLAGTTAGNALTGAHSAAAAAVRETGTAQLTNPGSGLSAGPGVGTTGVGTGTAALGLSSVSPGDGTTLTEPHRTLLATPTALEVGVPNGTQGWVRIRAEVSGEGQVNASLAAGSSASQEMLHRQLPALNAYLHSEQLAVTTTVSERSFNGERFGSAPGEAGQFQSNSGGANGGGTNAGGASNGLGNPATRGAGQSGARADGVSGLTSSYDGRAGIDSVSDAVLGAAVDAGAGAVLGVIGGVTRGGPEIESGQWLNVRA